MNKLTLTQLMRLGGWNLTDTIDFFDQTLIFSDAFFANRNQTVVLTYVNQLIRVV